MRLSYSKVSDFLQCPRKFWLTNIQKVPLQSNKYLIAGKEIHDILYYSTMEPDWKNYILSHPKYEEYKIMADNYIFYQENYIKSGGNPVPYAVEVKSHNKEWDFSMVFDRIDKHNGRKVLIDYKSDSKVDFEKHEMQLLVYAYFYNHDHPDDPITHYVPFFIKVRKAIKEKDVREITPERLKKAEEWLRTNKNDIESRGLKSNKFLPNPGFYCNYCSHKATFMCDKYPKEEEKQIVELNEGELQ